MVNIFEALFLLALDDEEGDIIESVRSTLEPVLAGAVLIELVLQNRIELIDNRIVVVNQAPTDHPVLDKALFELLDTARTRKPKYWINTLAYKKFLDEIGHCLVQKDVLVRKKKRLRLVIISGQSLDGKLSEKYDLKNRLRDIVLAGKQPDLFENVLLAFLHQGDLIKLVFTHGERKAAHKRIKELSVNSEEGTALGETLDEIVTAACDSG